MNLYELYQQVVLDYANYPKNWGTIDNPSYKIEAYNQLCGDKINIYLIVDRNIVKEVKFTSTGCALSKASTSILTEILKDSELTEYTGVFDYFQNILNITNNSHVNNPKIPKDLSDQLIALSSIKNYPMRIKCAVLAWQGVKDIAY